MSHVASKKLARAAKKRTSTEPRLVRGQTSSGGKGYVSIDPENKVERQLAIQHVIDTGEIYQPLATRHRNTK